MAAKQTNATQANAQAKAATKAPSKPRQNPLEAARARLAEVEAREAEKAKNRIDGLEGAVTRAHNQIQRWTRIKAEAEAKLADAKTLAGIVDDEGRNDAEAISDSLSAHGKLAEREAARSDESE